LIWPLLRCTDKEGPSSRVKYPPCITANSINGHLRQGHHPLCPLISKCGNPNSMPTHLQEWTLHLSVPRGLVGGVRFFVLKTFLSSCQTTSNLNPIGVLPKLLLPNSKFKMGIPHIFLCVNFDFRHTKHCRSSLQGCIVTPDAVGTAPYHKYI